MSQSKDPSLCNREGCTAPKAILADICRRHQEADKVLGAPTGIPPVTTAGADALKAMEELRETLRMGDTVDDDSKIGESLDTDDLINIVESARAIVRRFC